MVTRPADGLAMEMITIDKPKTPYLILEGINERKESREERCLHVVCPENKNTVKMGRGHQCEIRLQDISVSRMHSEIKFESGDFYVNDLNSKFGTLVRVDKTVELSSKVKLQVGRSLYKFQVE
jgi:predicted component of type VI protein secretion system